MVQIKIDQAAHPPGVAGIAREDLATGSDITLTATGGPYLQYLWRIINKPLDVLTSTRASSLLTAPDAPVTLLSPIDVAGTYLVEVSVDSGLGLGAGIDDIARITFYAGPTLATTPNSLPRREPAIGETTQHNVAGNFEGWGAELRKWFAVIKGLFTSRLWAAARINTTPGAPPTGTVVRGLNVASAIWNLGGTICAITFQTPLPDADYLPLLTVINNTGSGISISGWIDEATIATTGFSVRFLDATDTEVVTSFSFEVKLGVDP